MRPKLNVILGIYAIPQSPALHIEQASAAFRASLDIPNAMFGCGTKSLKHCCPKRGDCEEENVRSVDAQLQL